LFRLSNTGENSFLLDRKQMALASQVSRKLYISLFTKKKTTLFLMGGKDCLSLGLSLDPAISNLKEKFFIFCMIIKCADTFLLLFFILVTNIYQF
jgi:hypothetical protein